MIIFSKNIITNLGIISGYIQIEKNLIKKVSKSKPETNEEITNLEDLYIMPGIVNVDSHDLEEITTSSNVPLFSFRNIEYSAAMSGVTTIYHTIFYNENSEDSNGKVENLVNNILGYNESKISLIDNKIHLKFDIKSSETMEKIKRLIDDIDIDFLSFDFFMKRQKVQHLRDEYLRYHIESNFNITSEKAYDIIQRIGKLREESNLEELSYLIKIAHKKNLSISTSQVRLKEIILREFKDTFDIINVDSQNSDLILENSDKYRRMQAKDVLDLDLKSLKELILKKNINIISADYRPTNLLMAVLKISNFMPIHEAIKLVTKNPAKALGLDENIGEIKDGNIANIVCFTIKENMPTVVKLIYNGEEKITINHKKV